MEIGSCTWETCIYASEKRCKTTLNASKYKKQLKWTQAHDGITYEWYIAYAKQFQLTNVFEKNIEEPSHYTVHWCTMYMYVHAAESTLFSYPVRWFSLNVSCVWHIGVNRFSIDPAFECAWNVTVIVPK